MFRYIVYVFLGACSYGILSTFVKIAYDAGFHVQEVVGGQMFFGAVFMLIPWLFKRKSPISRNEWLQLIGVGFTIGSTGIFYYASLHYLNASVSIVLLFQFTWMGVLLEAVVDRCWPSKEKWLVLLLLLVGTVLASGLVELESNSFSLLGVLLGLLSALTYALFILFSGKVATSIDAWSRSSIMSVGSVLIVFVVFPPQFLISGVLFEGLFLWTILLAFFGVVIPTVLFSIGVPRIGVGLATILGSAELPVAVLLSSLVLREQVSLVQWIGVIFILLAIAIPEIRRRRLSRLETN